MRHGQVDRGGLQVRSYKKLSIFDTLYIIIFAERAHVQGLKYKLAEVSDILVPMKMDDFHCQVVELSFRVKPEEIDKAALLARYGKEDADDIGLIINSREGDDQHSHIYVRFRSEERVQVGITFHNSEGETEENDDTPPHMEDCVPWFGQFIKTDTVILGISAFYLFGKTFVTRVRLPVPLEADEEPLANCQVVGVSIQFPEDAPLENAIVQLGKESVAVSVVTHKKVALKEFDFYSQLKELESPVMSLVKKRRKSTKKEKPSEDRSAK